MKKAEAEKAPKGDQKRTRAEHAAAAKARKSIRRKLLSKILVKMFVYMYGN